MYRVTTPTHTFKLPFEANTIDKLILTYKQNGRIVLEKNKEDVTLIDNKIVVVLTQEETKLFEPQKAFVQLRVKADDAVMASKAIVFYVSDVLNDEVM